MNREELFTTMTAYKQTSVLKAGIQLGVFDHLADGPVDAGTVAEAIGTAPRGAGILLNALAAIGVVETDKERYWIPADTADLLVSTRPGYAGGMVSVFAGDAEWAAVNKIGDAVRNGGTVLDDNAETPNYGFWEDFAANAHVVAAPTAKILVDQIGDWARGREELKVLDVACGHGVYGYSVAQAFEHAHVWSLDWENVLPVAKEHATRMGVLDRTSHIAGDMFTTDLGGPYDLVLITNVMHHFSEEKALELLRRGASVLRPGGRVGLVGFTTSEKLPAEDPAPYLFDILMLAWTTGGHVHSGEAYERMLGAAGLRGLADEAVPGLAFHVLTAEQTEAGTAA
ncbi:class I SAM-dependent methyltransferase [Streptomyces sp. 2A115]|uniref:class I SAM-dependent methyltransferase n=1 Tax=Streptomyces sp. 2A115 TaxID=3457439 RepID=UPI003FD3470F